jgi:lipoprotein NlpD
MVSSNIISVIVVSLFMLSACTSSWKAPVSSYSTATPSKPTVTKGLINSSFYKVESGDTLYSISWRSGKDYKTLAKWNGLRSPYTIYKDQVLRLIPPAKKTHSAAKTAKPTNVVKAKKKSSSKPKISSSKPVKSSMPSTEKYKTSLKWRWPTKGKIIKSFKAGDDSRKGIVVSGKAGQPIIAAESGKVVYSGSGLIGYGQLIIIKHNDNYLSAYGYNRKLLVSEGDWITKGKQIATMGTFNQSVPSLHFEIRKNGNPVNPIRVLP